MLILVFNRHYLPGYKGGGPIVSLSNLFSALRFEINFRLVTTDRDLGDTQPYPCAKSGCWTDLGDASVLYMAPDKISVSSIGSIITQVKPSAIYLNSFFDIQFTARVLAARRIGRLPFTKLILAPRGEFSPGALSLKAGSKRLYIAALKAAGFLNGIEWHASTPLEAEDIRAALGSSVTRHIHIAPDLGTMPSQPIPIWKARAADEPFRVCFLSRISPKKNLAGAITSLAHMRSPTTITIYGPVEDQSYWNDCIREAEKLPSHVRYIYGGTVEPAAVPSTVARHDVFFLPTLGENFGHVILEALSAGLPVVTSDRTPWRGLAKKKVGYEGPIDYQAFARELDKLALLSGEELGAMRVKCRDYARSVILDADAIAANRKVFL